MTPSTGRWDTSHRLAALHSDWSTQAGYNKVGAGQQALPADYSEFDAWAVDNSDGVACLEAILTGQTALQSHPWNYLREMGPDNATFSVHECNPTWAIHKGDPRATMKSSAFPCHTSLVGNTYRKAEQQSALRNKDRGHRILIVPEPGNHHDRHALAVLVARGMPPNQGSGFVWTHVGYVPRFVAADLAPIWPHYKGRPLVGTGQFVGDPAKEASPKIVLGSTFREYKRK